MLLQSGLCLLRFTECIAESPVVKRFKGRSSRYLRNEFPELLKMPTLWTRSYFLSTAGNVSMSVIKKYIEQQWDKVGSINSCN